MSEYISLVMRRRVRERAGGRCEYCRLHSDDTLLPFEPDHIIARKHGGETSEENLAWACFLCNRFKGSDIASIDPATGRVQGLFHPRAQDWYEHFRLEETGQIVPLTREGRATVALLRFNLPEQIESRKLLAEAGRYP